MGIRKQQSVGCSNCVDILATLTTKGRYGICNLVNSYLRKLAVLVILLDTSKSGLRTLAYLAGLGVVPRAGKVL